MTKRKKRAWWKQKRERIAGHRFGGFRISFASPHSSFVLEPDYADIAKRLRLVSQTFTIPDNNLMIRVKGASHASTVHLKDFGDGKRNLKLHFDKEPMALMEDQLWVGLFLIFCVIRQD